MHRNINNFNVEVSLTVNYSTEDTDSFNTNLIHFTIIPHVIAVAHLTKFFFQSNSLYINFHSNDDNKCIITNFE
jgi:hypothetical protein